MKERGKVEISLLSNQIDLPADVVLSMRAAMRVMADEVGESFHYPPPEGLADLHERIRRVWRLPKTSDLLVTNSSTEAIHLALGSLEGAVAVQSPAYFALWRQDEQERVPWESLNELREIMTSGRARHIYVNSNFNGLCARQLTESDKKEIGRLAQEAGGVVIEDNPMDPLYFNDQFPSRILDQGGNILYISTMSKILGPGLRLGFVAGLPELLRGLRSAKISASLGASWYTQRLATKMLSEMVVLSVRERARDQAEIVREVLGEMVCLSAGGMYAYLPVLGQDVEAMRTNLRQAGVLVDTNGFNHPDKLGRGYLRLNYGGCGAEELRVALERVREVIGLGERGGEARGRARATKGEAHE